MEAKKPEMAQRIEIAEAIITLREDGIIEVNYLKGTRITVELQLKVLAVFKDLTDDINRPFLFTAMDYVSITKEAQENAIRTESIYPALATAVVADNLAYRLIANFYMKVHKPKTPYKVFDDEKSANAWLLSFL